MRAWSPAVSLCRGTCRRDSGTKRFGGGTGEDREMNRTVETRYIGLQSFHIAFLLLHNWSPLGNLDDVQAIRVVDPPSKRSGEPDLCVALHSWARIDLHLCDGIALPDLGAGHSRYGPKTPITDCS